MKKLLFALALINPMLQAEPADAQISMSQEQISPEMIQFVAKFKTTHALCISEYSAIEKLFKECTNLYADTFELLFLLDQVDDESLKLQCRQLHDELASAAKELTYILENVKELNVQMASFNALLKKSTDYAQVIQRLIIIAQNMHTAKVALETIKQYETAIQANALALAQEQESDGE